MQQQSRSGASGARAARRVVRQATMINGDRVKWRAGGGADAMRECFPRRANHRLNFLTCTDACNETICFTYFALYSTVLRRRMAPCTNVQLASKHHLPSPLKFSSFLIPHPIFPFSTQLSLEFRNSYPHKTIYFYLIALFVHQC